MAVYSQYNPATGQFEYMQGAPAAPQYGGDPASWNWDYYGQADPQAYPDYWARPGGDLLARAMQAGLGWTAPRQAASPYGSGVRYAFSPYDAARAVQDGAAYLSYLNQDGYYSQPAEGPGGGGSWGGDQMNGTGAAQALGAAALLGPIAPALAPYAADAAQQFVDIGRRASEAQDWAEGIY